MSGFVCCCSNPSCMANGCERLRQLQYQPHQAPQPNFTYTPLPLIEEAVRRIIREELTKAQGEPHDRP